MVCTPQKEEDRGINLEKRGSRFQIVREETEDQRRIEMRLQN